MRPLRREQWCLSLPPLARSLAVTLALLLPLICRRSHSVAFRMAARPYALVLPFPLASLAARSEDSAPAIRWIAQLRDHLECSIFRVHRQHERKLSPAFLLCLIHSSHSSRNVFASTSTSSTWSSSSTAETYCRILNDQPCYSCVSPVNVFGLFPTLRSTKFPLV